MSDRCRGEEAGSFGVIFSTEYIVYCDRPKNPVLPLADRSSSESVFLERARRVEAIILDIASTTHLYKMAAMTSTFLGSAVAAKAPVKVAAKKAVAPVASLDGLKKVRNAGNIRCSRKTYPQLLTR